MVVNSIVLILITKYSKRQFVETIVRIYLEDLLEKNISAHFGILNQMKKTIVNIGVLLFVTATIFVACQKTEEYPPVPMLEFSGFTMYRTLADVDSFGIMLLNYTDGDGDLGLQPFDQSVNFYVSYYKMVNGQLKIGTRYNPTTGESDTINFNARIPYLAPANYKGWIKGTIEDTINPISDPTSGKTYDTIMFKACIIDRAGNKSDTVSTPLILVKNQ